MLLRKLALLACIAASCTTASSKVIVHDQAAAQGGTVVEIFDTIDYPDFAPLAAVVETKSAKAATCAINVWLDSPGGNIDAAMKIGRLIHDTNSCVKVGRFQRPGPAASHMCASACVLILAAGAVRLADAPIGIHRPYSVLGGGTPSAEARYRAAADRIRTYLEEMCMPAQLYEEMMRVSAADVHWLSVEEKRKLGLYSQPAASITPVAITALR